jgi:hypothetical protein
MQVASTDIAAVIRQRYQFSVDRFPLSGPEGLRTEWYGLFRSDNGKPVGPGSVTGRYTPHTTDDVVALVDAAATAFEGVADVKCGFRDGHWLAIQPTKQQRLAVFGTDTVWPRLVIDAPYGGRGSFRGSIALFRDACQNLAILRQVSGVSVVIRHTNSLRRKMDELVESFAGLRHGWENLSDAIMRMESRQVNMVEFLRAVYGEPSQDEGRSATIHRNRTESIFRRLTSERLRLGRGDMGTDWMVTGWEAFNAVQGYVQHDSSRKGSPTTLDRIILANGDAAVHRAEELALSM